MKSVMKSMTKAAGAGMLCAGLAGCCGAAPAAQPKEPKPAVQAETQTPEADEQPIPESFSGMDRIVFNAAAARLDIPVFWIQDENENGAIEPGEVASLVFYDPQANWVVDGKFTKEFAAAHAAILEATKGEPTYEGLGEKEIARRKAIARELDQGRPTLVYNDLRDLSAPEKEMLTHLRKASALIDRLYALQNGSAALEGDLPGDHPASVRAFRRNWGPDCMAPKTESDPACAAVPGDPEVYVGVYPVETQKQDDFCETLSEHEDAEELMAPFTVVRKQGDELEAVPVTKAYEELTSKVAAELRAAAEAMKETDEEALRTYLKAAAKAFETNEWFPADEAWAEMNAQNSKWYVRVGPDEVYWDPCARKAGFHLTLARINQDSLAWQNKLTPVQQEMEQAFADLVGKPYKAREVTFHLPDFIDIVTNAGNDRAPLGATVGQSLPNWGPVANEGRGRTVAMTNLYTDPDSLAIRKAQAASLFTKDTLETFSVDPMPQLLSIIIHEAAHNLGPSHEYAVKGKTDDAIFGGPLATVMEELKAQTAALWYVEFLRDKGIIDDELARQTYLASVHWAFGHISRGMYTGSGRPKPYSQLAAIQVGYMMKNGALTFKKDEAAANGEDKGAFEVHLDKMPKVAEDLMKIAGKIKAAGQKKRAEKLIAEYVDSDYVPVELIKERVLRFPKASFVYAVEM